MRPSELFQRNCWISFEPVEGSIGALAEYIGPHKILWATDYPHRDGFFPGAPEMLKERHEGPVARGPAQDHGRRRHGVLRPQLRRDLSGEPILHLQAADALELTGVCGNDRGLNCRGMSSDQQVVAADRFADGFQPRAYCAVLSIARNVERQYVDLTKYIFDSLKQSLRAAFCAPVA